MQVHYVHYFDRKETRNQTEEGVELMLKSSIQEVPETGLSDLSDLDL